MVQVQTDPEPTKPQEERVEQVDWKTNPNNCDTSKQYILAETLECKDKPKESIPRSTTRVSAVSGDWVAQCQRWASQAGISLPQAAITLISRESKCNPTICNPNGIACGIPQALPWTKMGCSLSATDAPCQIKWMHQYVMNRYGSWQAALNHSYANNWY